MREHLIKEILMAYMSQNPTDEELDAMKLQLTIILNDYEVQQRVTEVAVRGTERNEELITRFLVAKTVAGRTERTVALYKDYLTRILDSIGKAADEITADDIRLYLALRQKRDHVSKTSADNELRCLRSFFAFLTAEEILGKNPCLKIDKIKGPKVKKKSFTDMDVEKIRNACQCNRERAMVEIFLSTGCRVKELTLMKIEDIHGDEITVHGKGDKYRKVYLNAKSLLAIENYLKERKDSNEYLFAKGIWSPDGRKLAYYDQKNWYMHPELVGEGCQDPGSIESVIRKIGKRAGVKPCHPHRFRRTCATFALRRGMPIEQVSQMLGHEQISTTQIYLDLSEEDLKIAHEKYVV
jgi:site-specific recombinase XerD